MKLLKPQTWHFSLASLVSLLVHALLVFLLYGIYSEFHAALRPAVVIVARGDGGKTLVLPELAVQLESVPTAAPQSSATRRRPDDVAAAMPRQESGREELLAMQPSRAPMHQESVRVGERPRAAAEAVIPVQPVELPAVTADAIPSPADLLPIAPRELPLPRHSAASQSLFEPAIGPPAPRYAYLPTPNSPRRPVLLAPQQNGSRRPGPIDQERKPAPAFAHRMRIDADDDARGAAIERGLEFLARMQLDDGRWQFRNLRDWIDLHAESPGPRADAAATGLALLAFLGAGHDHLDARYHRVVDDALQFLIRTQQPDGEFFPEDGPIAGELSRFYSHGIATLALCEAFGMTGDDRLREPAQRALDYLAGAHRNVPDAWRILPGRDADSATVSWQLATLRCGQLAGLHVDPRTIEAAEAFVAKSREDERAATATTTAVGLAMKLHLGGSRSDAQLRPAAETLLAHPPEFGDEPDPGAKTVDLPADNPRRDTYYWYYGSEAMFSLGGNDWQNWSRQLYPQLVRTQVADGPFAGSWDAKINQSTTAAGRLYVTAMNLLSLEIENRHLQSAAADETRSARRDAAEDEPSR
jgi:hypothetical protein